MMNVLLPADDADFLHDVALWLIVLAIGVAASLGERAMPRPTRWWIELPLALWTVLNALLLLFFGFIAVFASLGVTLGGGGRERRGLAPRDRLDPALEGPLPQA